MSLCVPAAAEETETYLTWNGSELVSAEVPASITKVTTSTTELNDTTTGGWYIVRSSVEISSRVTVTGDVHLILADSCVLTVNGGINVSKGNSLTIYAQSTGENTMGKLTATTTDGNAGIGGGCGKAGGTITINGGDVTATSDKGAIIGGGDQGEGGQITISGGTVIAEGTKDGISGTFSTGTNGSAFITASRIDDQSGKGQGQWSGVIFEGENGKVYGSEITLAADAEIPANGTLEIEAGHTLIVGADVTLTNNGKITNSGTIINNGEIINSGTISGDGIIVNHGTITGNEITGNTVHEAAPDAGWRYDGSGHWHPCTVADCTEHTFDTAPPHPQRLDRGPGGDQHRGGTAAQGVYRLRLYHADRDHPRHRRRLRRRFRRRLHPARHACHAHLSPHGGTARPGRRRERLPLQSQAGRHRHRHPRAGRRLRGGQDHCHR